MRSLSGAVVVVSGGSRGIGNAVVQGLLRQGGCVATFSRSGEVALADDLKTPEVRERLFSLPVDARDSQGIPSFVNEVVARFQKIDALVNNAGVAQEGVLALTSDDAIDQMLQINLRSVLILTRECVRHMLVQRGGVILTISSVIAERGFAGLSAYAATKAGLIGMTRSLARELGPRNIRVNALAPGYVETEMSQSLGEDQREQIVRRTPLGRLATPADLLPVVEFLLSPDSGFITGQTLIVDGGAST